MVGFFYSSNNLHTKSLKTFEEVSPLLKDLTVNIQEVCSSAFWKKFRSWHHDLFIYLEQSILGAREKKRASQDSPAPRRWSALLLQGSLSASPKRKRPDPTKQFHRVSFFSIFFLHVALKGSEHVWGASWEFYEAPLDRNGGLFVQAVLGTEESVVKVSPLFLFFSFSFSFLSFFIFWPHLPIL